MNLRDLEHPRLPYDHQLEEISLGYTTLHFFSAEEYVAGQIGYSVDPNGNSLVGENNGDWKQTWGVIGFEDLCGDPIFVDIGAAQLPVYTAAHGAGDWNPTLIADSFEGFRKSLKIVREIAAGRENAVKLEANPIGVEEAGRALNSIGAINPNSDIEFWMLLLGIYK